MLWVGLVSAIVTAMLIRFTRNQGMLDMPGQRRLHHQPTARGGGLGMVIAVCVGMLWLTIEGILSVNLINSALWIGMLGVAVVGWQDDRLGLAIHWRLLTHLGVASGFVLALYSAQVWLFFTIPVIFVAALLILAMTWSINLHNFMDGSDGLLVLQSLFVVVVYAGFALLTAQYQLLPLDLLVIAALIGFLPWNLPIPRAHIFMGDVGSGTLGFLLAALGLMGWLQGSFRLAQWLILLSAFLLDATATLLFRMMQGRRWWQPHREHLYQWIARVSGSHRTALEFYLLWNLLWVTPALLLTERWVFLDWPLLLGTYMLAVTLWLFGKRHCLYLMDQQRKSHALA